MRTGQVAQRSFAVAGKTSPAIPSAVRAMRSTAHRGSSASASGPWVRIAAPFEFAGLPT